jgi:hypothetical protein
VEYAGRVDPPGRGLSTVYGAGGDGLEGGPMSGWQYRSPALSGTFSPLGREAR